MRFGVSCGNCVLQPTKHILFFHIIQWAQHFHNKSCGSRWCVRVCVCVLVCQQQNIAFTFDNLMLSPPTHAHSFIHITTPEPNFIPLQCQIYTIKNPILNSIVTLVAFALQLIIITIRRPMYRKMANIKYIYVRNTCMRRGQFHLHFIATLKFYHHVIRTNGNSSLFLSLFLCSVFLCFN